MRPSVRPLLGISVLLLAVAISPAAETGTVVKVIDGDTLRVSVRGAKRSVRLVGVDTPEPGRADRTAEFFADEAARFTRGLALGQTVRLETDPEGDTRDRYGRLLRYVFLPDGRLLNALIVAEGYGHAYTRFPFSRLDEFRALERTARESGRGLWSPDAIPRLSAAEAHAHEGATATVCDVVASTKHAAQSAGQPTYLNLGRPYPDQLLAIVIWGTDRARFEDPETRYSGARVCVTGKIRSYRGKPEIFVHDPSQITIEP